MSYRQIFDAIIRQINIFLRDIDFMDSFRFTGHFIRMRKLSMVAVIMFILNSTKQKMATNIDNLSDIGYKDFPKEITRQAISKARQGINPELLRTFFDYSVECFYHNAGNKPLWHNTYSLFAIDGFKVWLPKSKSNFTEFGEMFSKDNPKRKWSMALGSTIYDVLNDYIVHGLLMPYLGSERSAAIKHCEALEDTCILNDTSIIIMDRGYYSEDMYRYFASKGYICLLRLKEDYRLSKNCPGDHIDILKGDPSKDTEDIKVRVIKVKLDNGTFEYLATNLFDDSLSDADFKELYFRRWPIEVKYKELKSQFQLEYFSGNSSITVEQDFYVTLFYANLVSLVKKQADLVIKNKARPTNKHRYQSSRAYIIGRIRPSFMYYICNGQNTDKIDSMFMNSPKEKIAIIPNRTAERKKAKSGNKHRDNMKPCFC